MGRRLSADPPPARHCLGRCPPTLGLPACPCRHLRDARTSATERVQAARRSGVAPEERRAARSTAASLAQVREPSGLRGFVVCMLEGAALSPELVCGRAGWLAGWRWHAQGKQATLLAHPVCSACPACPAPPLPALQTLFVHADFLDSDVEAGSLDTITCLRWALLLPLLLSGLLGCVVGRYWAAGLESRVAGCCWPGMPAVHLTIPCPCPPPLLPPLPQRGQVGAPQPRGRGAAGPVCRLLARAGPGRPAAAGAAALELLPLCGLQDQAGPGAPRLFLPQVGGQLGGMGGWGAGCGLHARIQ